METRQSAKRVWIGAMVLGAISMISTVHADTFLVNDDRDPDVGVAEDCTSGLPGKRCSLRDALAAADHSPGLDTISFDLEKTIYLRKQLTVEHPVVIDGGVNKVNLRVSQQYSVAQLVDRFAPYEVVDVVLPEYSSTNGNSRPMLELHGDGSAVRNLRIDGSITPHGKDVGIARIDYNSDSVTDFLLFTLDSSESEIGEPQNTQRSPQHVETRWPIAGGIKAIWAPGSEGRVEVSDCEFIGHNTDAIFIESFREAMISGNSIEKGLANLPFGAGAGIFAVFGANLTVSGNDVADFREGVSTLAVSGMQIADNQFHGNQRGISIEYTDATYGANRISGNVIEQNSDSGITIKTAVDIAVDDNTVRSNQPFGIDIKEAGYIGMSQNRVIANGTDSTYHGGIRIAEASGGNSLMNNTVNTNSGFGIVIDSAIYNTLAGNTVNDNGGAGIVLVNAATGNTVQANTASGNVVGVLSTTLGSDFPFYNQIIGNNLSGNLVFDAADFDPQCNDYWAANTFATTNPSGAGCIH